jgi:hypothetical protein
MLMPDLSEAAAEAAVETETVPSMPPQDARSDVPPQDARSDSDVSESEDSDDDDGEDAAGGTEAASVEPPPSEAAQEAAAAPAPEALNAAPMLYRAFGDGLRTAIAGQKTSFTIEGYDAESGQRRRPPAGESSGGHGFSVTLTGTAVTRTRIWSEDDGTFTCEFRPMQTGKYRLAIMRHGQHLPGSPHALAVEAAAGTLKDWKAHRQREVSSLRQKRAAAKASKCAKPEKKREPSPRIVPHEQLQKAYAIALEIARGGRGADGAGAGARAAADNGGRERVAARRTAAAATDEHVLAV